MRKTYPKVTVEAQESLSCWLPDNRISMERQTLACNSHLCIVEDDANTIRQHTQNESQAKS